MVFLEKVRSEPTSVLKTAISEHIAATESETKSGSSTWLLSALGWPETTGDVLGYGTIILKLQCGSGMAKRVR